MKTWDQIKVAFEAEYHFLEDELESIRKIHEMIMEIREIV